MANMMKLSVLGLLWLGLAVPQWAGGLVPLPKGAMESVRSREAERVALAQAKISAKAGLLDLEADHEFRTARAFTDHFGYTHVRFQQIYQGVPVWGGEAVVHLDPQGKERPLTDALHRSLAVNTQPSLQAPEALAVAKTDLAPKGPFAYTPRVNLVIIPETRTVEIPGGRGNALDFHDEILRYTLAYHVHLALENGVEETVHRDYLVNAHTGGILRKWDSLHTSASTGTGHSQYSGTVSLSVNSLSQGYELRDLTRGQGGNATNNYNHSGPAAVYSDADNSWGDGANYVEYTPTDAPNGQTAAVDAHYGVTVAWDLYKNVFARDGLDGQGRAVKAFVHYDNNYDNAFWSDECFCMTFGDGNIFTTLTALDVVVHEASHGLCSSTANLDYVGESGGLNEANSDIFGSLGEFYARGGNGTVIGNTGGTWTIGEQLRAEPLRYMVKPSKDGASRDAWSPDLVSLNVHYSSGPMNRCFYFLSQGASSVSTHEAYSSYLPEGMAGLGNDKAGHIWFRALTAYLTSTSNYAAARLACLRAAIDLHGQDSVELQAVRKAFAAINVGRADGSGDDLLPPAVQVQVTGTSDIVAFEATAEDNLGVARVEFFVDGSLVGTAAGEPFIRYFDSRFLSNGDHALVAKAYDFSGNTGESTPVVFAVSNPSTQSLLNPGFEEGMTGWNSNVSPVTAGNGQVPAHGGTNLAKLNGKGYYGVESLSQAVSIASNATQAKLGFWLRIQSAETPGVAWDYLRVQIRDASGNLLKTLATYSNNDVSQDYVFRSFDLLEYRGQTIRIHLEGQEDSILQTTFLLDDFSILTSDHPDVQAPIVVSLGRTSTYTGSALSATLLDNVGVQRVEFWVDGTLRDTVLAPPYSIQLQHGSMADGLHSWHVRAYDQAGNEGVSPIQGFRVDPNAGQLLQNPGFELGDQGWNRNGTEIMEDSRYSHGGTRFAALNGWGYANEETIEQTVAVPDTPSPVILSFWLRVLSSETGTAAKDTLKVRIQDPNGTELKTLQTFSNQDKSTGYQRYSYDLSEFRGKTIRIHLLGTEDSSTWTVFLVDDFALFLIKADLNGDGEVDEKDMGLLAKEFRGPNVPVPNLMVDMDLDGDVDDEDLQAFLDGFVR